MQQPLSDSRFVSAADLRACRETLRTGSRTFLAASHLLPRQVRDAATALYAFCRQADDAVDLGADQAAALDRLWDRLDAVYAGRPYAAPVDRAFAGVVARFAIPRALPEALFDGFEWDLRKRRYEDLGELKAYAVRVAGTVGAMMALLMGVRSESQITRACDLGVAMQLTNIARDVGEDARAGRLYLPRKWLLDVGIDPDAWLARPAYSAALGAVVQRLLLAADALYARSDIGVACLPLSCRPAIFAARHLYAEIGRRLEEIGLDSVTTRAVVGPGRKTALVAHALGRTFGGPRQEALPTLEQARFVVEAVIATPPAMASTVRLGAPLWRVDDRVGWVFDLFIRLNEHDAKRGPSRAAARQPVLTETA